MRSVLAIAAAGALTLSLAGCGGSGAGGGAAAAGGGNYVNGKTFTMVISSDPGNLDPHFTSLSVTYQVDQFLYDSLVNVNPDGEVVAGLASKWSGDSNSATFTLRKGITCSDGSALSATDVADNINFVGDPKNNSTRIGVFVPAGATATADDSAGTVTVKSPAPDAFLVRDVGGLPIVCAKGMNNRDMLKQGADGTGPYTVTEAVPDDHYVLTKRDGYRWGPGDWNPDRPGMPAKVVLKVVSNETTAANLLLSGQVNLAHIIGPDRRRLQGRNLVEHDLMSALGWLWFNQRSGEPTADEPVRRALVQALKLRQLGQVVSSGSGKPSTGLVPTGMGPCRTDTVRGNLPGTDIAAAKHALDAAGWTAGGNGVRSKDGKPLALTLYYSTSLGSGMKAGAELVQKAWQAIGVDVTIKSMTNAQMSQVVLSGQGAWSTALLPANVSLPTQLVPFVSGPTPPKGNNFSSIQNSQYTAHVKQAAAKPGTAGCDQWAAAEKALFQHVNVVPFVDSVVPVFAKGATFAISEGSIVPTSIRMLG